MSTSNLAAALCACALGGLAGCGDGDEAAAPPPPTSQAATPAGRAAAAAPKIAGKPLVPMVHIEDRVTCKTPSSARACDMAAPVCDPGDFCLQAANGAFCGPCPERAAIRVPFQARDFLPTENRDPFQSFVVNQPGLTPEPTVATVRDPSQVCVKPDQLVATSYSVRDLKLVGIVAQGQRRKALMLDNINFGNIIRKGDCVGKERAFVREIGQSFITFSISPDPTNPAQQNYEELSVKLYPEELTLGRRDRDPSTTGPVIAAPPTGTVTRVPSPTGVLPTVPSPTVPSPTVPSPPVTPERAAPVVPSPTK